MVGVKDGLEGWGCYGVVWSEERAYNGEGKEVQIRLYVLHSGRCREVC